MAGTSTVGDVGLEPFGEPNVGVQGLCKHVRLKSVTIEREGVN